MKKKQNQNQIIELKFTRRYSERKRKSEIAIEIGNTVARWVLDSVGEYANLV